MSSALILRTASFIKTEKQHPRTDGLRNGLELHVLTPSGEEISSSMKHSLCGGHLDVDAFLTTAKPVENVVWKTDAPKGNYMVWVVNYSMNKPDGASKPYQVRVLVDGKPLAEHASIFEGKFTKELELQTIVAFDYSGESSTPIVDATPKDPVNTGSDANVVPEDPVNTEMDDRVNAAGGQNARESGSIQITLMWDNDT